MRGQHIPVSAKHTQPSASADLDSDGPFRRHRRRRCRGLQRTPDGCRTRLGAASSPPCGRPCGLASCWFCFAPTESSGPIAPGRRGREGVGIVAEAPGRASATLSTVGFGSVPVCGEAGGMMSASRAAHEACSLANERCILRPSAPAWLLLLFTAR